MQSNHGSRILLDSELLSSEFRFSDPANSVESLTRDKPDSSLSPDIVGFYDETPAGGRLANPESSYIWCCHCQKNTHWKGYIVEDGTGHRFTIGNKCGLDHYGGAFEHVITSFKEKRARKGILRVFHRLATKVENLDNEISALLICPVLLRLENKSKEIVSASPKGIKALREAVLRGSLDGIIRTRNLAAEVERLERYERALTHFQSLPSEQRRELRDQGLRPELDEEPIIDSKSVNFGYVVGTSILGLCDPRKNALQLRRALIEFQDIVRKGTDAFASKVIAKARRKLFDETKILRDSLIEASFGQTFFHTDNLVRISDWSACYRGFSFENDGVNLIVEKDNGAIVSIRPTVTHEIYIPRSLDAIHYTEVEDDLVRQNAAVLENPDDPNSKVLV